MPNVAAAHAKVVARSATKQLQHFRRGDPVADRVGEFKKEFLK